MRLVFVIADLRLGGAQKVLLTIANGLGCEAHDVTLITLSNEIEEHYQNYLNLKRVRLNAYGPSKNFLDAIKNNLRRIFLLRRQCILHRPDTVISFLTETNIITFIALLGLKKRLILCERNNPSIQPISPLWGLLRRICYPKASLITVNSIAALNYLGKFVAKKKLQLIENPVDQVTKPVRFSDKSKTILFTGRLVEQKNLQTLLIAFSRIKEVGHDWELKIFGEGPAYKSLKNICCELGLNPEKIFLGVIPDCKNEYSLASIFVLPSKYEGTPNSLLEAMSFGCAPIVSSTSDGALDYVSDEVNGLIFNFNDPDHLTEKLMRLIYHRNLREKFALNSHQRVAKNSSTKIIDAWNNLISDEKSK